MAGTGEGCWFAGFVMGGAGEGCWFAGWGPGQNCTGCENMVRTSGGGVVLSNSCAMGFK